MPITPNLTSLTLNTIPEEIFLVLGGLSGGDDATDQKSNFIFGKRIADNEKVLIGPNNIWQSGKYYDPYIINGDNNYVLNSENNIVYLCVSNNVDNTTDLANVSSVIPTHTTPTINQLSDGYSWIPLFKVDSDLNRFISKNDLPLPEIVVKPDYASFSEEYQDLCGAGVTSFGCCCMYFKENSVDELTSEVYTKGDVTNETIFSDCYECQKLANALDREVLFLTGLTAGSISSNSTGENPLCPSTKVIKTTLEQLEANKYETVPGSSNEFAYNLLSNFENSSGIMFIRINLGSLTETQKTISLSNPTFNIADPTGTGALARFRTIQISEYSHKIIGVELVSSGTGYNAVPDIDLRNYTYSAALKRAISVGVFPTNIFENIKQFVSPKSYKIMSSVSTDMITETVGAGYLLNYGILVSPSYLESDAPVKYTKNNKDYFTFEQALLCGLCGAVPENVSNAVANVNQPWLQTGNLTLYSIDPGSINVANSTNIAYGINVTGSRRKSNNKVNYLDGNGNEQTITGLVLYSIDSTNAVNVGDVLSINGSNYNVMDISSPAINKMSGSYLSSGVLSSIIPNSTTTATRSYGFNISINMV